MKNTTPRLVWLDLLKVIAIFMVVAGHCGDFVSPAERFEPWYLTWGTLWGSLMRPAVPLFVMVTGALLLPVRTDSRSFYQRRLPRLLVPFFLWSVLYNLFPWFTGVLGYAPDTILHFFPWGTTSQSFASALHNICLIPFNFSCFGVQMWYVYLLAGIYLYLPIFSVWVQQSSQRERHFFLLLWGISLTIPYLRQYLTAQLWGTCSWNEFGMLYYFAGFNGYLLLGYELRTRPILLKGLRLWGLMLFLFAIGYGSTFIGFKHVLSLGDQPETMVELFYTYCSPNVMLMSVPIFILAQQWKTVSHRTASLLRSISSATLGIWMIHYILLGPCHQLLLPLRLPTMLRMTLCSVLLFFITWGIVTTTRKCGNLGKWIMG